MIGNARHVESLGVDHSEGVRKVQSSVAISVSCSDSRVPADAVWSADETGELLTPVSVGDRVWIDVDGRLVANDAIGYAVSVLKSTDVVVLGHTGCGAATAAYVMATGEGVGDLPASVETVVSRLVPLVEEIRKSGVFDVDMPDGEAINRFVGYAVVRQIEYLTESDKALEAIDCRGFVYDFQRAHSDDDGATYPAAANGKSDPDVLADVVPEGFEGCVQSIR